MSILCVLINQLRCISSIFELVMINVSKVSSLFEGCSAQQRFVHVYIYQISDSSLIVRIDILFLFYQLNRGSKEITILG